MVCVVPKPAGSVLPMSFDFAANENPLSSPWIQGGTIGLDWHDMASTGGNAYSTTISSGFDDCIACLPAASFPRRQYIEGVIWKNPGGSYPGGHEAELHLHTTIAAHSVTSYELLIDVVAGTFQATRWDGAVGNVFTGISTTPQNGGPVAAVNGDTFRLRDDGAGNFSLLQNGTVVLIWSDTTYTGGAPGIAAFWLNAGNTASNVGWQSIVAGTW